MENNLNENQVNYVEPEKNNKGKNIIIIFLSIIVILLAALLVYMAFFKDNEKDNNTNNNNVIENNNSNSPSTNNNVVENSESAISNNNSDTVSKATNVPVKDTFAIQVETFAGNSTLYYYILIDGKVYEYTKEIEADIVGYAIYSTSVKNELSSDATNENMVLKEIKGLPIIKRIKGMVSVATDPSMGVLLVAENGEVYIYTISGGNAGDIKKAQFLDDYKVDDVISYYAVPGCTNDGSVKNFKTCGGEYNIIDKEGKSHHYRVNQDGTLTKK